VDLHELSNAYITNEPGSAQHGDATLQVEVFDDHLCTHRVGIATESINIISD
jgi:hypothetical protein